MDRFQRRILYDTVFFWGGASLRYFLFCLWVLVVYLIQCHGEVQHTVSFRQSSEKIESDPEKVRDDADGVLAP